MAKAKKRLRRRGLLRPLLAREALSVAHRYIKSRDDLPKSVTVASGAYLIVFKARVFEALYRDPASKTTMTLLVFWVKNDRSILVIDDRRTRPAHNDELASETQPSYTRH